ncbi:MAG TPA: transcription-repair coupling factor, partial [Chromatiaceae bacterium]|nr:transcription-repair coupling factor [Chromatiaceae bacterium]
LIQYKRIASAESLEEQRELKVEMIDRFGLLPEQAKNLFDITELKLEAQPLGIRKIEAGPEGGRIHFEEQPSIDPARLIQLIQTRPREYQLDGGERLRFFADLSAAESRVENVRRILSPLRD